MEIVFHAHSGLRYLVLLALALGIVLLAFGWLTRRPWEGAAPILFKSVVGLVDLQVLLGLVLFVGGRRPAGIHGHLALMLAAAVALHVASALNRRGPRPPRHVLPLIGVLLATTLVVGGILSIRDSVL